MSRRRNGWTGRSLRKTALVALMIFAAVAAPVALPIRMIVALRRRETSRTEQVVRPDRTTEQNMRASPRRRPASPAEQALA